MTLKTFKSYTKSTRGTVLIDRRSLWKGKPLKSLTFENLLRNKIKNNNEKNNPYKDQQ